MRGWLIHDVDPEFSVVPDVQISDLAEEWWMKRADMICGIMRWIVKISNYGCVR